MFYEYPSEYLLEPYTISEKVLHREIICNILFSLFDMSHI